MAQNIIQGRLAVEAYLSDNANIPFPAVNAKGDVSETKVNYLVDNSGTFKVSRARTGDIVYNVTLGTSATVIDVEAETDLLLNDNIFTAVGQEYIVYSASSVDDLQNANNGCVLYVGSTGDLEVTPLGQDSPIVFKSVPVGFFPVQVIKVWVKNTTASEIIALW
jgi:hypothetical protein